MTSFLPKALVLNGHLACDGQFKPICGEWGKRHHTLLHRHEPIGKDSKPHPKGKPSQDGTQERGESKPNTSATANASSVSLTSHVESAVIIKSKFTPAYVSHQDHFEKKMKVFALLHDASNATFITNHIRERVFHAERIRYLPRKWLIGGPILRKSRTRYQSWKLTLKSVSL